MYLLLIGLRSLKTRSSLFHSFIHPSIHPSIPSPPPHTLNTHTLNTQPLPFPKQHSRWTWTRSAPPSPARTSWPSSTSPPPAAASAPPSPRSSMYVGYGRYCPSWIVCRSPFPPFPSPLTHPPFWKKTAELTPSPPPHPHRSNATTSWTRPCAVSAWTMPPSPTLPRWRRHVALAVAVG